MPLTDPNCFIDRSNALTYKRCLFVAFSFTITLQWSTVFLPTLLLRIFIESPVTWLSMVLTLCNKRADEGEGITRISDDRSSYKAGQCWINFDILMVFFLGKRICERLALMKGMCGREHQKYIFARCLLTMLHPHLTQEFLRLSQDRIYHWSIFPS